MKDTKQIISETGITKVAFTQYRRMGLVDNYIQKVAIPGKRGAGFKYLYDDKVVDQIREVRKASKWGISLSKQEQLRREDMDLPKNVYLLSEAAEQIKAKGVYEFVKGFKKSEKTFEPKADTVEKRINGFITKDKNTDYEALKIMPDEENERYILKVHFGSFEEPALVLGQVKLVEPINKTEENRIFFEVISPPKSFIKRLTQKNQKESQSVECEIENR